MWLELGNLKISYVQRNEHYLNIIGIYNYCTSFTNTRIWIFQKKSNFSYPSKDDSD